MYVIQQQHQAEPDVEFILRGYQDHQFPAVCALMLLYCLSYFPTIALTDSFAMQQVKNVSLYSLTLLPHTPPRAKGEEDGAESGRLDLQRPYR